MTILKDVNELSREQLVAMVAALQAKQSTGNGIKVWELGKTYTDKEGKTKEGKGNLSVYGLQKMPVTLYPRQWLELLNERADDIRKAIEDNRDVLSWGRG